MKTLNMSGKSLRNLLVCLSILTLLAVGGFMFALRKQRTLVGIWHSVDHGESTYTFNANQTMVAVFAPCKAAPHGATIHGTYKYEVGKPEINWTFTDMPTGPDIPATQVAWSKHWNGKSQTAIISWVDDNSFYYIMGNARRKFSRIHGN